MFNSTILQEFRKDFDAAMKSLEAKYGVTVHGGSISYSPSRFEMKVKVVSSSTDDQKAEFERMAIIYGFKPEDYGRELTLSGRKFKLVGFNSRRPKFACQLTAIDGGKDAATTVEAVKYAFR